MFVGCGSVGRPTLFRHLFEGGHYGCFLSDLLEVRHILSNLERKRNFSQSVDDSKNEYNLKQLLCKEYVNGNSKKFMKVYLLLFWGTHK